MTLNPGFLILAASMMVSALPASAQMSEDNTSSMTCQQMMDTVQPVVAQMTDRSKISMAQKVMTNAKAALDNGNEAECRAQMQKVMAMTHSNSNR
jgi:hypothetical protein